MLININNHKFELKRLEETIKNIEENIDVYDGKLNQIYLELSALKNQLVEFQQNIKDDLENDKQKLFSKSTFKELIVGIVLAIILAIGGGICKTIWDSYLEKETAHRHAQITLTNRKIKINK